MSFFQKQGGYVKTLMSLFPEIDFDIKKFPALPSMRLLNYYTLLNSD